MNTNLANKLNVYLADIGVSFIKFHNLHWNVVGAQFKSVHEYLEVIYDGFATELDEVAEALKMAGVMPLASMKSFLEVTTISELESRSYPVSEVLSIAAADISSLKATAEAVHALAGEDDAYAVVSMMEDHLKEYNKTLWFLNTMMM